MVATRSRRPPGPSSATAHRPKSRKKREKETRRDWSALPDGLLYDVSNRLASEVDATRFRSVCSSWRSAALKRRLAPWLVGHRKNSRGKRTLYSFFSLAGGEIRPIDWLPEARLGKTCCGSSHGWLALIGEDLQIILYNPITRSRIPLPEITSDFVAVFGVTAATSDEDEVKYYYRPSIKRRMLLKNLAGDLLLKVLLSSDPMAAKDCTVVLLGREGTSLAFCSLGDDVWTLAPIPRPRVISENLNVDALFYKGQLYISLRYHLFRCKLRPNPEVVEMPVAGDLPPREQLEHFYARVQTYLVESSGNLLLVSRWIDGIAANEIQVYNIEFNDTLYLSKRMDSLGDCAIFIGQNHSFSVSTSKLPECKANCVYIAGYVQYLYPRKKKTTMFNLGNGDKQIIPFCLPDASPDWESCAWITPSIS